MMARILLLALCLLGITWSASAQDAKEYDVPFTLSIFGPVSTNPLSYDRTNSNICLGLINCANMNVYGLTAAYGYNRVYNNMFGVSLGFLGNVVSNQGYGIEAGFGFNINGGEFRGIQFAPLNVTADHHTGLQFGLVNYTHKRFVGLQLSPLNIVLDDSSGVQMGFINYTHRQVNGLQLSMLNVGSDEINGVQAAFFLNVSDEAVNGLQLGMLNISAGDDSQSQMAVQIGVVNISNQAEVVPIGLVNFVRGGRFNLELNRDSLGFNNLALTTGSQYFYSVWSFESRGINPDKRNRYHPHRSPTRLSGWGLAYPYNTQASIRLERLLVWPTNFDRDEALIVRLLGEFSPSTYFQYHAGLEQIHWVEDSRNRSSMFRSHGDRLYSLTAGVSFNLLGWWKADR